MKNALESHLRRCSFYLMGGASWILEFEGITIGCDPALAPAGTEYNPGKRIIDPILPLDGTNQIDYWLLTHNHVDHIDEKGINYISPLSRIIAHPNLMPRVTGLRGPVTYLNRGEETIFEHHGYRLIVKAMPAVHGSSPEMVGNMGSVNGYLITLLKAQHRLTVYITGDTVTDPRIYEALNTQTVDILIANLGNAYASQLGGPITLSVNMFEDILHCIKPKIALPVHINDFDWFEMAKSDIARLPELPGVTMPQIGAWTELKNLQHES